MNLLRSLYAITIFLSAFLLFAMEPMAAKQLLPTLGGSSAVWTSCLVFFSTVLVLGYLYAHWVSSLFTPTQQAVMHILLLTLGILILGIHVKPDAMAVSYHPALTVFRVLATVTGLPYLALSATTPLLTAWYAESFPGRSPYRLYALSNLASLLALACYPLLIEPHLSMDQQTGWWSTAFVLFAVLCGAIAWQGRRRLPASPAPHAMETATRTTAPGAVLVPAGHGRRYVADRGHQPHEPEYRGHSAALAATAGYLFAYVDSGFPGSVGAHSQFHATAGAGGYGIGHVDAAGYPHGVADHDQRSFIVDWDFLSSAFFSTASSTPGAHPLRG